MNNRTLLIPVAAALLILFARPELSCGAELRASDGASSDHFGISGSLSGSIGLLGASEDDSIRGSAYVFRNLDTATGTVTQNVKLTASARAAFDYFGSSVSLFGSVGLVGAQGTNGGRGSAYLFRNLDAATGSVTENAILKGSDIDGFANFGRSVSLAGNSGLVGAPARAGSGSAYLFRNLDTAANTVTETAILAPSTAAQSGDSFGATVYLSGSRALVSAFGQDDLRGAAFLYRDLDTAIGTVTEAARLIASDRQSGDDFGNGAFSGNIALVGAFLKGNVGTGAAYVFRNLDTATATITESAKLLASDPVAEQEQFGKSVSVSGTVGLIGAIGHQVGANTNQGAVYLFLGLDTLSGTVTESVEFTASVGRAQGYFGESVSLEGDRFLVGSDGADGLATFSGKAYTGTISSLTTLDGGNASRLIERISFTSHIDWIVGETTDENRLTLGAGDTARVVDAGHAVFIGKNAGSDGNTLRIDGILKATEVYIGSVAGNADNTLQLENTADFEAAAFRLAPDNLLKIEGNYTAFDNLRTYLGSTELQVWDGNLWQFVDSGNQAGLITSFFTAGYTEVSPVPEPGTAVMLLGCLGVAATMRRRRGSGNLSGPVVPADHRQQVAASPLVP